MRAACGAPPAGCPKHRPASPSASAAPGDGVPVLARRVVKPHQPASAPAQRVGQRDMHPAPSAVGGLLALRPVNSFAVGGSLARSPGRAAFNAGAINLAETDQRHSARSRRAPRRRLDGPLEAEPVSISGIGRIGGCLTPASP
jgi:hypothetical protein